MPGNWIAKQSSNNLDIPQWPKMRGQPLQVDQAVFIATTDKPRLGAPQQGARLANRDTKLMHRMRIDSGCQRGLSAQEPGRGLAQLLLESNCEAFAAARHTSGTGTRGRLPPVQEELIYQRVAHKGLTLHQESTEPLPQAGEHGVLT